MVMDLVRFVFEPLVLVRMIFIGLVYAGISIAELVITLDYATLSSLPKFRNYWFARFYSFLGPRAYETAKVEVSPLLAQAKGVVLDIGTGSGLFLGHYNKSEIDKIYAIETNPGQHPSLLQNVKKHGLADVVEVLDQPLELLQGKSGLSYGEVDTIVTVQVLCSVEDPQGLTEELYKYLKPGGRWIVYEHVKIQGGGPLARYQMLLNVVWPHLFGGCSICRDAGRTIQAAGKWTSVSLHAPESDGKTSCLPHTNGILYKAS